MALNAAIIGFTVNVIGSVVPSAAFAGEGRLVVGHHGIALDVIAALQQEGAAGLCSAFLVDQRRQVGVARHTHPVSRRPCESLWGRIVTGTTSVAVPP